jgi:UDP:flavonoid glycosyltransferase YjiC (YdhE family)
MTILVISPDYASHATPLITLAAAWQRRGHRVVVASGPGMASLVAAAGMQHAELVMSRGSNPGVIRSERSPGDEARSLQAFFAATKGGMVEALRFQAEARSVDLLWQPRQVAIATMDLVELHAPDTILVDHLAFGASIGLRALGVAYGDVVLGHPTALPVGSEVYGVPSSWPSALTPDRVELESLRAVARGVTQAFSVAYDSALHALAPGRAGVDDAFAAHGDIVLYNYPAELHPATRTPLLPRHAFIGSAVRTEIADSDVAAWLSRDDDRPLVVVSLGTFLSARADVLSRIAAALRSLDVRVALAIGPSDLGALGALPEGWLVRPSLPQVALLAKASLLITHAGNNSVTEALTFGVPMLALPFSTDQFDGAAAVEQHLAGLALDPNTASRPLVAGTVRGLIRTPPPLPALLGTRLRQAPGPETAYAAMLETDETQGVSAPAADQRESSASVPPT